MTQAQTQHNEIAGSVTAVLFRNEENGYTVLRLDTEERGEITVVGCMPGAAPGEGLAVAGSWTRHASYGEQFKAETVERRMPAGTKAIYLYRKRFADDEPIVRVETYLPYEACSFILGHDFNRESLYQVLSKRDDTRVTHVTRICEARAADPEDAAVLGLKRGRPVHYFQTIGYNQSGKLIELSFAHYRGDQSRFRVELFRE